MAEIIVKAGADGGIYQPDVASQAQPGDIIILEGGQMPIAYCYLGPLKGTPDNPIIIRNRNGAVRHKGGFDQKDCQEVLIDGHGDSNVEYGFIIDSEKKPGEWRDNSGIGIQGFAKGIEARGVSITNSQFGVWIKNEPSCDAQLNAHVIERIFIHHCMITNTQVEGIYGGSTNFLKGDSNIRPLNCSGQLVKIPPPLLKDIRINDNIFDSTGRAAIQLSFAALGMSEVLRNKITNSGKEHSDTQGNGINIGSLTRARVADNFIRNTLCAGICTFGAYTEIENNDIDLSGQLDGLVTPWAWGIWIDTRETQPFSKATVKLLNNKIGQRGNGAGDTLGKWNDIIFGDQFGDATNQNGWNDDNVISGNISTVTGKTATMDVSPKIKWSAGAPVTLPKSLLITAHAYTDKTISTSKALNKKKTLLTSLRIFSDGSVEAFK